MNTYALITGATSGIGFSFAKALAKKGYNLILTGRREKLLKENTKYLQAQYGSSLIAFKVEFTNNNEVENLLNSLDGFDNIEILVNNAGYSLYKSFNEDEFTNQMNLITVHNIVPIRLMKAVLPQMIERKKGTIINVCSLGAYVPLKNDVIYSGTKAFMVQFSRSLHLEVYDKGVYVQALVPGFVKTDFHSRLGIDINQIKEKTNASWMKPDDVVNYSLRCLRKRKIICVPGLSNRLLLSVTKLIPEGIKISILEKKSN